MKLYIRVIPNSVELSVGSSSQVRIIISQMPLEIGTMDEGG
jgi:hypothetical protein